MSVRTRKRRRIYTGHRKLSLPSTWELRARRLLPLAAGISLALIIAWRSGGIVPPIPGFAGGFGLGVAFLDAIERNRANKEAKKSEPKYLPPRQPNEHVITRVWRWWEMLSKVEQGVVSVALGAFWIGLLFVVMSGGNLAMFIVGLPFGAIIGLAMYIGGRRGTFS